MFLERGAPGIRGTGDGSANPGPPHHGGAAGRASKPGGRRSRETTAAAVWAAVHTERRALVEDLTDLTDLQWETPSLCQGWAVRDVVAHLAATATLTRRGFIRELASSGLSTQRIVDRQITRARAHDAAASLAALHAAAHEVASPPRPVITRVVEILVHAEDIRHPLGVHRDYPSSWVIAALLHLAGDRSSGGRARLAGLTLAATDTLFITGAGPLVAGPAAALLLAAGGRAARLQDLSGPGRAVLADRMHAS